MLAWFSRWQSDASAGLIHADHGSIAVGRDIRDSAIKVGLDEQETGQRIAEATRPIAEQLAALADQVARDKGVPAYGMTGLSSPPSGSRLWR